MHRGALHHGGGRVQATQGGQPHGELCRAPFARPRGRLAHRGQRTVRAQAASSEKVSKGINLLEWGGKLVPQGVLVKGVKAGWRQAWVIMMTELAPQGKDGAYQRPKQSFTGFISTAPGAEFPFESKRYRLYVGNACPWCHRVLLALAVTGLAAHIDVTFCVDDAERASRGGWVFDEPEPIFGAKDLREVYDGLSPGFSGRCTAPFLVDQVARRPVTDNSGDMMLMFSALSAQRVAPDLPGVDLRPPHLVALIDETDEWVYNDVNNAVYQSGFSTTQQAYDAAQARLWPALDRVEALLQKQDFLCGDVVTDADVRLFPTAARFDAAYNGIFKCCKRRIGSHYPAIQAWMRRMYGLAAPPGCPLQSWQTFDVEAAVRSYYGQLFPLNAGGIVPQSPSMADVLGLDGDEELERLKGSVGGGVYSYAEGAGVPS
ncbi:unnamed protein product [Pedinophyceae sp. YPF-701]|nr:unnamed protein product [Pedinophyceae sp. YPF-701]